MRSRLDLQQAVTMWMLFCALWPGAVLVRSQLDDDLDNDLDDRFLSSSQRYLLQLTVGGILPRRLLATSRQPSPSGSNQTHLVKAVAALR